MIVSDLGIATAYGYAKSKGYAGTEEEFATLMASIASSATQITTNTADITQLKEDLSMIAPVETGTTASQAHTVGKYFILNNQLCKAKTDIASGVTFALNTNYTVTTVADELYTALH